VARDVRLTWPAVHRCLNSLETTHLFEQLPAYTISRITRLLKSPEAYWSNPGPAVFRSGNYEAEDLRRAREHGAYFETVVCLHLRVVARLMTPGRLYFWRSQTADNVRQVHPEDVRRVVPGRGDACIPGRVKESSLCGQGITMAGQ